MSPAANSTETYEKLAGQLATKNKECLGVIYKDHLQALTLPTLTIFVSNFELLMSHPRQFPSLP